MQDKLQQLTEKLYNEGLAKGKQEAESLLKSAKEESEKMIASAAEECRLMKEKTKKECSDLRLKAEGDIKTFVTQSLNLIRQSIGKLCSIVEGSCSLGREVQLEISIPGQRPEEVRVKI